MPRGTGLRVFVSATTDDLGECRRRMAAKVEELGHTAVLQDTFPPDHRELAAVLNDSIRDCHVVLLLVGFSLGRELADPVPYVPLLPAGWTTCSYTQLEFFLTVHWRKHFFLFFVPEKSPLDTTLPGTARDRQIAYREHIRRHLRQVRRPIRTVDEAVDDVGKIPFQTLRVEPVPWPEESRFEPYHPVLPPVFVGRNRELRDLERHLHEHRGVSLVGDTRMGKSSLLRTWEQRARHFCPVVRYLNAQDQVGCDESAVVASVTEGAAPGTGDAAADALVQWAGRQTEPPLLLVDEGDALIKRASVRFFERLRAMMDRRVVRLVLATRRDLAEAFHELKQSGSPFGNSITEMRLGPLDEDSARELAQRAGGHAAWIREWAGTHPFFQQLAGWHLERAPAVDEAMANFRSEAYTRLKEIWIGLSDVERQSMRGILDGPFAGSVFKLQRRGLVTGNRRPFGKILDVWWQDDPQ